MLISKEGSLIPCICVTNRKLCRGDFYDEIQRICEERQADMILLREKDLTANEYIKMAERVIAICNQFGTTCILHSFVEAARALSWSNLHIPISGLDALDKEKYNFKKIGTSVHSVEQLQMALKHDVDYVIAGHIFDTDCKKGLPGRGTEFVADLCQRASIPVYGIGGIDKENADSVIAAGATGVCLMSGFMNGSV